MVRTPNTLKWHSMIVWGCLNPFLAILIFFDSYHALATLWKLKNLEKLAFLANFGNFCPKLEILAISKFGRKWLKIEQYWSKNRFFGLFDNFSPFLANPEKKKKIPFSIFFFQPKYVFFVFLRFAFFNFLAKWNVENLKKWDLGWKKKSKNRKKNYLFRIG